MASGATTRLDIPYPVNTDPANFANDMAGIAEWMDTWIFPGVVSPTAPGSPDLNSYWWCSNVSSTSYGLNFWDGTAWHLVSGVTAAALAAETSRAEAAEATIQLNLTNAVATLIPKNNMNPVLTSPIETSYINTGTAPNGTLTIDVSTSGTSIFYTTTATGNFTFNITATATALFNALLATGQEMTISVKIVQGSTPYYCTGINVDGTTQTVKWQGGSAPTAGFANGIDVYTMNIVKTASATYTVLASLTQF